MPHRIDNQDGIAGPNAGDSDIGQNPLIILLQLVIADPELRSRFEKDPASVFCEFGLGCPAKLVGKNGRFCPVMPPLPEDPTIAEDLRAPYWRTWVAGAVDQLHDRDQTYSNLAPLPTRSSFGEEEWGKRLEGAKATIARLLEEANHSDILPMKPLKPTSDQTMHLINLSLPKTGSSSIAKIFARYRARHEFAHLSTMQRVIGWCDAFISDTDIDSLLLYRQAQEKMDVDSCTCLHLVSSRLPTLFPDARFILCVRDFPSWMVSWVATLHNFGVEQLERGIDTPWSNYCRHVMPGQSLENFIRLKKIGSIAPDIAPQLADYWCNSILNVLQHIPADRLLVLRLHDLSTSLGRIASFAGVEEKMLYQEYRHSNIGSSTTKILDIIDSTMLEVAGATATEHVEAALASRCPFSHM